MKYHITKTDGSPLDPNAKYFVLRLDDITKPDNKAARLALITYAREAKEVDTEAATAALDLLHDLEPNAELTGDSPVQRQFAE